MVTPVNNPFLLDWLQRRGAFGGQYGPPNQGTQVASLFPAPLPAQQGNVPSNQLLFDAPVPSEGGDTSRTDHFGSGTNPYSKPGPATLAGGARRWMDKISGKPQYDFLEPPGFGGNPFNRLMDKYSDQYADRRRSGGLSGMGDVAQILFSGRIPGANLLTAAAGLFSQLGAHHDYNPSRDSNLFYETDRGRMTWDSMDPGGGGEQAGTLNAYNMLMAIAENDPNRDIQTQVGWANVKDLAESIKSGEFYYLGPKGNTETEHTKGLFTEQPTNFAQMPSQYISGGKSMTNEDAVRSLDTRYGDAWNRVASEAYAKGLGYNGAVALSIERSQELKEMGQKWNESMKLSQEMHQPKTGPMSYSTEQHLTDVIPEGDAPDKTSVGLIDPVTISLNVPQYDDFGDVTGYSDDFGGWDDYSMDDGSGYAAL